MTKNDIINEREATLLLTNLLLVKAIFAFPREIFSSAANAAWIEVIYMSLIAFLLMELSFATYRIWGKQSVIEIAEDIGGKPFGRAIALIVAAVLSVNLVTEIRIFSESVKIILLPKTEIEYIIILFALAISIGRKSGFKALAAINAIFFPICLLFLGFIVIFLFKSYEINNLFPILGKGGRAIAIGGIKDISCFADIIAVNLIIPHCRDISVPKKSGRRALAIASVAILLICLSYALSYPYPKTEEYLLPVYQLTKRIRAGEYFQRFEAFFEFVWEISQLLYSSIYVYLICEVLGKVFDLRDTKIVSYAIVMLVTLIAAEPVSVARVLAFSRIAEQVAAPFAYALPVVIPLLYRKRKV